ncbi:hypothetical protein D9Q98_007456 [Chlorella vulgaris]|uniref:SOUL heme-binding protein n=1 Tax=Chlorella vulgaris TaxID=3077 RepID=A0A9D4TL97_CHLVU|nr:hypothetical protein D9Q98_007456 [Chlorella vulgaris]
MPARLTTVVVLALALATVGAIPAEAARPSASAATLTAAADASEGVDTKAPWFCHNLDCPRFSVLESTDDYELREYEAASWVSTDVSAYAYALAARTGFQRLYQYIDGANKEAVKVPMTAPVVTRIGAAAGPFCKNNFTIAFFVPFAFQSKGAPQPNNPDVYLSYTPALKVYVAQTGGFVVDDYSISRMANRLTDALDDAGLAYASGEFFFAGYDPPFRLAARHNEVAVLAGEAADSQPAQ